jgi:hypothetical protein
MVLVEYLDLVEWINLGVICLKQVWLAACVKRLGPVTPKAVRERSAMKDIAIVPSSDGCVFQTVHLEDLACAEVLHLGLWCCAQPS